MIKLFTFKNLAFLVLLLFSATLFSQDNLSVSYKGVAGVPDFLNVCGDPDNVIVTISNNGFSTNSKTNVEAAVNLFTGVEFASFDAAASSPGVTIIDNSNPKRPVFSIPDIDAVNNASVDIAFSISARCGIVDTLEANDAVLVFDTWDLTYNFEGQTLQETDATFEYRDAFAITFLTVGVEPTMNFAGVGNCFDREITISNSGLDGVTDQLVYTNIQGSGISVNSITVNGQDISFNKEIGMDGDTVIMATITSDYFVNNLLGNEPSNGDAFFDPNETLKIIENICVVGCSGDRGSLHTAAWGCDDVFCQESSLDDFIQLGEGNANAVIDVSDVTPSTTVGYCQLGSTSLTVSNDGFEIDEGFADMINVEVGIGMGSDFSLSDGGLNATEIIVAGVSVPLIDALIRLDGNALFASDVDGAGGLEDSDGDGFFDDLPPGESLEITLFYEFDCSMAQSTADSCFNNITTFFTGRVDYFDVACNEEVTRLRNSYLRPSNTNSAFEDFATPDAFSEGDVFTINHFESRSVRDFERNCGDGDVLIATVQLPAGINPVDSEVSLSKNDATTPINILNSTVNGTTWEITFDSSGDEFLNGNYDLQLGFEATCEAEVGFSSFPVQLEFYCPECDCRHTWYCADIAGPFIHKEVPPCPADPDLICEQGLKTTGFEVNRSTFGFTDNTYTTPFNPADANQKVAVSCDSVEMIISSEVGNSPINGNFGFTINHNNIDGTDDPTETFLFGQGEITISKGGSTFNCPVTAADLNVSDVGGFKTYRFEFPNCLSDLGITLAPGDQVEFRGNFAINPEGPYVVQFKKVPNFRAFGYSIENSQDFACESFGDIFTIAKTNTLFSFPSSSNFPEGCEETFLDYRIISVYNGFDNEYGEELYPSIKVDSIAFTFDPAVLEGFDVFEPEISIPGHPIFGNEFFPAPSFENFANGEYIAYFDTLNIVPSLNEVRSYSFSFRIRTIANCKSDVGSSNGDNIYDFTPTVYYQNRYYAQFVGDPTCVELREETTENDIQFTEPPTFSFVPVSNPDVFLLGDTAVWDVRLCNTSFESDAGVLWFAAEDLVGDIEVVAIEDITNPSATIDLDVGTYGSNGNNGFAFSDGVLRADGQNSFQEVCKTIRLKVIPRRCGMLNLDIRTGWNCIPYADTDWTPENYPPCEDLTIPLSIVTQDPFLEANIFEQPNVSLNLCEPIDITILLRNEDLGTAFDMKTQIIIPLQGASLVPGSVEFAYPSSAALQPALGDPVFVEATPRGLIYQYDNFSNLSTYLDQNGLEGFSPTNPTDSNEFRIKYQIITDCDFVSNSLSYYNFQGVKGCKDSTNLEIGESLPIEIMGTGNATGKLYDIEYGSGSGLTPLEASTIEVLVTNLTNMPSSDTEDFISFSVPVGATYIPNSTTAIEPVAWNIAEPQVDVSSGVTILRWSLPSGLLVNQQARMSFQLDSPDYDCAVNSVETQLVTTSLATFDCVTMNEDCQSTTITSTTGDQIVDLPVNNSSLTYTFDSITSVCNDANTEVVTIAGNITIGEIPIPSGSFPITYVYDANGNGVADDTDTQLEIFVVNGPLDVGAVVPFTHTLNVSPSEVCNIIFTADATILLGEECEYFETNLPVPQLQNVGDDMTACSNISIFNSKLGTGACAGDYEYSWTAIPPEFISFLTDTGIAEPDISFDPSTVAVPQLQYVLQTVRPGCAASTDTLTITLSDGVQLAVDIPDGTGVCPNTDFTLTASGAETYTWTNAATGEALGNDAVLTLSFTDAITLTVTGANSSGCEDQQTITLNSDASVCPCINPEVGFVSSTASSCGEASGSATIHVNGDASNFVYTWSPDMGTSVGAGNMRENLPYGGYFVTISDATSSACSTVASVLVQNEDGPTATVSTTPATCNAADGTAVLLPSNYFYAWSDNGQGNARNDLAAGVYFASFSDPAEPDCANAITVIIGEDNPLEVNAIINTIPDCGATNGSVTIEVLGGSGNYSFLWEDGNTEASRNDLTDDLYTVTITDLGGSMCQLPFLFVLPANVPMADVTLTEVNDVTCAGLQDGSAFIEVNYADDFVGTPDTILSNDITTFTNGALPAGSYCYVIENEEGCVAGGACFTIEEPDPIQLAILMTEACNEGGTIEVNAIGGTLPYNYDWDDVPGTSNSSFRQNLEAGFYNLAFTDANDCSADASVEIKSCSCTEVDITSTTMIETTCGNAVGMGMVNINGDPSNYNYTWSPDIGTSQGAGESRTDLPVGFYSVTVTDPNDDDCFGIAEFFITASDGAEASVSTTPASCSASDGGAVLSPDNFTYEWPDGTMSNTRNDLRFGVYSVVVIDPNNADCPGMIEVIIQENNPLEAEAMISLQPECGESNGVVTIAASGSTGDYTFVWEDGFVGNSRDDLSAGLYTVNITALDDSGCSLPFLFVLTDNVPMATTTITDTIDVSCNGLADGQVNFTVDYAADFAFPADTILSNNFNEFENGFLPAGAYCFVINDNNGCVAGGACFTIEEPDAIDVNFVVINACNNQGTISTQIVGGTAPYTFAWDDISENLADRDGLAAGTYGLTITDTNGCQIIEDAVLVPQCEDEEIPDCGIFANDTEDFAVATCEFPAVYCLPSSLTDLGNININVNGEAATFAQGCDTFSVVSYDFQSLANQGEVGPYELTTWALNDTIVSGTFENLSELASLMDSLDNTSTWTLEANSTIIYGGNTGNVYGPLEILSTSLNVSEAFLSSNFVVATGNAILVDSGAVVVIINNVEEGCTDTLNLNVSCENNLECDFFGGLDSVSILGASCVSGGEFCLEQLTPQQRDSFNIFVDGVMFDGSVGGCVLDSLGRYDYDQLTDFMGPYEITAWEVGDSIYIGGIISNMDELVDFMNANDPTGIWVNDDDNLKIEGGDSSIEYGRLEIYDVTNNVPIILGEALTFTLIPMAFYIEVDTGVHQVVLERISDMCSDTITLTVECDDECEYFGGIDSTTVALTSCEGFNDFCLEIIAPEAIDSFTIFVDSLEYEGNIGGCLLDSIGRYDYDQLQVFTGPYEITGWNVNDSVFIGGTINTMAELVDFMNANDPTGAWVDFPNTFKIEGGTNQNDYGALEIRDIPTGTPIRLGEELTYTIVPMAVYIELELGIHDVILINNESGCADTINVTVVANPGLECDIIEDIINPYDTVKYIINPDILEVSGDSLTLTNFCEDESTGSVDFVIDSLCVTYIGSALGLDTACIEICDELGICDTLFFDIEVVSAADTIFDNVFINEIDTFCLDTTVFLGSNFEVTEFCADMADGQVDFFIDPINYCLEYTGLEPGQDTSCIEICDDLGFCDTLYFVITVDEFDDDPIANDDVDTTFIGEPVIIDIKANDSILGDMDTTYILDEPAYGEAFINLDCSATYDPNGSICDITDEFTYVICNVNGCDTASVMVYIDCQGEIIIYTALSPNGDGANDVFYIAGIEFFPANELCIYNRWGNQVYITKGYKNDWEGTWDDNKELPDGTYFYVLQLNDEQGRVYKGYFELFR